MWNSKIKAYPLVISRKDPPRGTTPTRASDISVFWPKSTLTTKANINLLRLRQKCMNQKIIWRSQHVKLFFFFCFTWKQKNLERKKNIFAHSSIVKANLHGPVRKKILRYRQQIYKETKTDLKTDENELWRIWLLMTKLALRWCQTMQPNFVSRMISAPLPTLLLWSRVI